MDHIVATSMYTDRSKHDIDVFLSQLSDSPIRSLREAYDAGHRGLDLMDEIVAGPDDPEASTDYLRRFAARHEFTLEVLNLIAGNELDLLAYPSIQVPPPTMDGRAEWTTLTFPTNTLIASQTWMPAITVPRLRRGGRPCRARARRQPARRGDAAPLRLRVRAGDRSPPGAGELPRVRPRTLRRDQRRCGVGGLRASRRWRSLRTAGRPTPNQSCTRRIPNDRGLGRRTALHSKCRPREASRSDGE
jgi:hypothetical protein